MRRRQPEVTKSSQRLFKLFGEVQDEAIRQIMAEVVLLERKYRSASNFPVRLVRDVVDNEARLQESLKG